MLFLFVLMLVGVDASDSVVETIKGQRLMATVVGLLFGARPGASASRRSPSARSPASTRPTPSGNVPALAQLLFSTYVFAFEATSALLITAAIGAMVLAHRERLTPEGRARPSLAAQRMRDYVDARQAPGPLPAPGCLRPAQRGGHPRAAARRHGRRDLGLPHPHGPRHGPLAPALADDVDVLSPDRPRRPPDGEATRRRPRPRAEGPGRPATRPTRGGPHERDAVPRPVRDPVHDRLRGRAHPPQRDRGVHVRRADAQRVATWR